MKYFTYRKPHLDSTPSVYDKVEAREDTRLFQGARRDDLTVRALHISDHGKDGPEDKVTVTFCDPEGDFHTWEYWMHEIKS